jgi:hypothetical protein
MMFSSNAFRFVLVLAAAFNAVTSADPNYVDLGAAGNYVILAETGISTVPNSIITGNIGVSPITGAAMTGFDMVMDSSNTFGGSTQLTGKAHASDFDAPTPSLMTQAVNAMRTAYTDAAGLPNPDDARNNLVGGILGGPLAGGPTSQLTPGVYTFTTDVHITGDIHFNGSDTDIFVIQMAGNLVMDAHYNVILEGGALPQNIVWQVAGSVDVGAGAHMEGILLVKTAVTFKTLSSLDGRILAQTACTLQMATITDP